MNQPILQFALRELTSILRRPRLWTVFAIVCAMFAFTGPFGTYESLQFPARLGYWVIVQVLTWGIALSVISLCGAVRQTPAFADLATVMVGALIASVPIGVVVELVGVGVFDRPLSWAGVGWQIMLAAPISLLLGLLAALFLQGPRLKDKIANSDVRPGDRLLRRLPPEKQGKLLYLSMQDHYVEVVTVKGATLILLRFQEALEDLHDHNGLQIHRSHWVALEAVEGWRRDGGKLLLEMSNGAVLPVSRSFSKAVRQALDDRQDAP